MFKSISLWFLSNYILIPKFIRYTVNNSLQLEEQIVKTANRTIEQGVGVRVISGERSGYAYCDEITVEAIRKAALTAAHIADSGVAVAPVNVTARTPAHDLYRVEHPTSEEPLERKIELLQRADKTARAHDTRIREVQASFLDKFKLVMIVTSEGLLIGDVQPLTRLNVMTIADDDGNLQQGYAGGGGRNALDFFHTQLTPESLATAAARQAIVQLEAVEAPAGAMEVVLGSGWPGILLHEAVGHGLEADFNRKGTSAFSGLIGQKVASELCTVVDEGTIPGRRGSLNIDDEGHGAPACRL